VKNRAAFLLIGLIGICLISCKQVINSTTTTSQPLATATENKKLSSGDVILPTNTSPFEAPNEKVTDQPKIKGLIDIGNHQLFINCIGSGTPTIILEAGWNDVLDTWSYVQPDIAEFSRVCSSDRAGLGKSETDPLPRSMDKEVTELYALLEAAGVEGPYILVGHSYGGMLMRLFVDHYPESVAGLVLVDSAHPDSFRRNLTVLPPESPDDGESLRFYREWLTYEVENPTVKIDPQLLEAGSLGNIPLVVLTAKLRERAEDFPKELNEKFIQNWVELQEQLALLSTNSRHVFAEQSGHFVQHDQPELVIEAVLEIIEQSR